MEYQNTLEFATKADHDDELNAVRDRFHFPVKEGKKCLYFTGNSLGLQPKSTKEFVDQELSDWLHSA